MTLASAAGTTGTAPAAGADAPIKALNPVDGLFLRAEHLAAIQDYARALGRAVGRAGGAGVAYGCTTTYGGGRVTVGPGLAIAPTGHPLLLASPLSELPPTAGTAPYLVVELWPDTVPTGTPEQIFGLLCEDPCAGGDQFRPYVANVVRIAFREPSLSLPAWTGGQLRSAAASAYFEAERTAAPSLLPTSERDPGRHAALESATWSAGTDPSPAGGVPVGLLIRVGSDWVLDVWAARRDRMETPPERGWARRTGRRAEDVFLAQVLQLQAQLADLDIPTRVRSGLTGAPTLPEDFVELPPAGYLPVDPASEVSVDEQVTRLFGPDVDLRFCTARADELGLALEQARHLDRIPLSASSSADRPKVDVIVPDGVPAARAVAPSVHFAGGTVTVQSGETHPYRGLARLGLAPGSPLALAFAAEGMLKDRGEGLWATLQFDQSPFELRPQKSTLVQGTLAAHQTRNRAPRRLGEALQRFDLFGQLECGSASTDPASGLPTFEGKFSGQVRARLGTQWHEPSITANVRLSVRRTGATEYVLRLEASGPRVVGVLDVTFTQGTTGWSVTFDSEQGGGGISAELDEVAAENVPLSPFRWAAERGLAALGATDIPLQAVRLLFAGAGPPASGTAYSTPHDWVFFTRRHLLDCAPSRDVESAVLRLDLYVDDEGRREPSEADQPPAAVAGAPPPAAAIKTRAGGLRYVGQLAWDLDTDLLFSDSADLIDAWRQYHPAAVPTRAMVWAGGSVTLERARVLAEQVVQRMSSGTSVPVDAQPGPPEIPTTPGSSGAVVVGVSTGGLASAFLRLGDSEDPR